MDLSVKLKPIRGDESPPLFSPSVLLAEGSSMGLLMPDIVLHPKIVLSFALGSEFTSRMVLPQSFRNKNRFHLFWYDVSRLATTTSHVKIGGKSL